MPLARIFWSILLVGMGLRGLWALTIPVNPVSDSAAYHQFARTLVEHGVYGWNAAEPSAYWAVGTSALVALTYLVTDGFAGVVLLNLIAGFATIWLTYVLAARWFDEKVGLWAMGLVAFWPNLIFFTTILASELFFIAGTLGGLYFWQRPQGRPMVNLLQAGLIWGLTAYVRPVILLVPLALAIVDMRHGARRFVGSALSAVAAMALISLVAMPWTIRNKEVLGEAVMVSTNFGPNLWMGNNPDSNGGFMELPERVHGMGEIERSKLLEEDAKTFIRDNPAQAARLLVMKTVRLHIRETIGVVWNEQGIRQELGGPAVMASKLLATGYWYLLLAGAVAGVVLTARREGIVAALFNPAVALWGYFTVLHVIVVADDRYHMPSSVFIACMAAVALARLPRQRGAGEGTRRSIRTPTAGIAGLQA